MNYVALFMRAWIETLSVITPPAWRSVALFMRAWIETADAVAGDEIIITSPSS